MSLGPLLRKELHWSRRNALLLAFLLLLLPVFFAGTSVLFQDVLPRNVPVAVVAEDDDVTDQELALVADTIDSYTDPTVVDDEAEAARQLERESVHGIVGLPAGLSDENASVTVTWTIDGSIVPFQSPSEVIGSLMQAHLELLFDADVDVDRQVEGDLADLPEYLFPTLLMTVAIFFAFTYVPYLLRRERAVLDRLRVESSLEALVAAKLLSLTALLLAPVLVFHAAAWHYDYAVASLDAGALFVLLLTSFFLSTVSATVTVLARFGAAGTFVNLVLMLGLLALSALVFPLGFFSTLRATIAGLLPTHYAMVVVRSLVLKDVSLATYLDFVGMLVGFTLLALVGLKLSLVRYRRTS